MGPFLSFHVQLQRPQIKFIPDNPVDKTSTLFQASQKRHQNQINQCRLFMMSDIERSQLMVNLSKHTFIEWKHMNFDKNFTEFSS